MENKSSFRFLWIGQSLANCGDVFYIVALITILYQATGSALYLAAVPFLMTLSRFTSGAVAPVLLDRFSLKGLLLYAQLGKTLALLGLVIITWSDLSGMMIGLTFLFVTCVAFLDGWASPARNALIPQLIPPNQLVKANSFLAIIDQSIRLGAWPIGGMLVAFLDAKFLLWFTVVLFVLATIFMTFIDKHVKVEPQKPKTSKWHSLKEGWTVIWSTPFLRIFSMVECIEAIAGVVWIAAILFVYIEEVLQASEQWWGYINASFFAGLMLGGLISLWLSDRINQHLLRFIIVGAGVVAVLTLGFGLITNPWFALLLSFFIGFIMQIKDISQQTLIQTRTQQEVLPKVYAANETILAGAFGFSSLLFGYVTDLCGVRITFCLAASLLFVTTMLLFRNRHIIHSSTV
ncbi:MFS transporter [Hazenella sp. IB182353]|uniref:MFS transporter n=1 Tax=Polycladospora coralii TaxID=2771432 RepID=UPI001746A079|nr:MFS transporter [Polycladospora coralii]MBS7531341.1 MFS transporter [Polycladospora coralii]